MGSKVSFLPTMSPLQVCKRFPVAVAGLHLNIVIYDHKLSYYLWGHIACKEIIIMWYLFTYILSENLIFLSIFFK